MPEFILGMNAKLYQGTAAAVLGSLTELTKAKDVTLTLDKATADITTRGNAGWRAKTGTLKEASVTFDMIWKPGDAGFDAIKDAYLGNAGIELAILDQDRATSGAQGLKGTFDITSFARNEALEEAITVSVTADLTVFDQWVEV